MSYAFLPGQHCVFDYPTQFKTLPDYSAHRGQLVEVLAPVSESQYENMGDRLYKIRASDGWTGVAWESELLLFSEGSGGWR